MYERMSRPVNHGRSTRLRAAAAVQVVTGFAFILLYKGGYVDADLIAPILFGIAIVLLIAGEIVGAIEDLKEP